MVTSFYSWHPVLQAFVATLGTWGVTALGAMLVLFTRRVSQKYLDASLGMAEEYAACAGDHAAQYPRRSGCWRCLRRCSAHDRRSAHGAARSGHCIGNRYRAPESSGRHRGFTSTSAEGLSRGRALWYGQLSAIVEPIAGVVGAALVLMIAPIMPYALAFAAGAMIFVVAEELIPEAQANGNVDLATGGVIIGFAIMMTLDVALG